MRTDGAAASAGEIVFGILAVLVYLGAAVYMIYDPETVGNATGVAGHGYVGVATPAGMVRFAGCAMLALPGGLATGAVWWPLGIVCGLAVAIGLHHVAQRLWPL